jgi:hypothetical protein
MRFYHGTPFDFDNLKSESWVTSHKTDAFVMLFMKNLRDNRDPREGRVAWFEIEEQGLITNVTDLGSDYIHAQTIKDLEVDPNNTLSFKDFLESLPDEDKRYFYPKEVIDLLPLIKG